MITKKSRRVNDTFEVTFECEPPGATEVALVCDANQWEPLPMPRTRRGRGPFRVRLAIPAGSEAQFRYLVDGSEWLNDEAADGYVRNEFGTENGVVVAQSGHSRNG
jgi:1,4-alpha-glucan branching enzyme